MPLLWSVYSQTEILPLNNNKKKRHDRNCVNYTIILLLLKQQHPVTVTRIILHELLHSGYPQISAYCIRRNDEMTKRNDEM